MGKIVLIKEEKNLNDIWFYDVAKVEQIDGELMLWKEIENERYCIYKCWVDKIKYFAVL